MSSLGLSQRPAIERLDFNFTNSETGYLTHGIHPYPAKYIPQIPNALIQEFSRPGETVGDVFCGSGTTLVEALLLGRHAVGVDANPLACLISAAKTSRLTTDQLLALSRLAQKSEDAALAIQRDSNSPLWASSFKSSAPRPDIEVINFWFDSHVIEELAEILHWCRQEQSPACKTVALAAFSSIVVAVSKQDSDTRYVRRTKAVQPGSSFSRFSKSLRSAVDALNEFAALVPSTLRCTIEPASVLVGPEIPKLDLMVCSPPYPNAYSYHLYHMTRMVWLGFDQPRFKAEEIGSHRKYSRKGSNAATPETFRQEMVLVFEWLTGVLKSSGIACFVIGDSTIRGERIDNTALLRSCAEECGYVEVMRVKRQLQSTKKAFNPAIGKIKEETIIGFENRRGRYDAD